MVLVKISGTYLSTISHTSLTWVQINWQSTFWQATALLLGRTYLSIGASNHKDLYTSFLPANFPPSGLQILRLRLDCRQRWIPHLVRSHLHLAMPTNRCSLEKVGWNIRCGSCSLLHFPLSRVFLELRSGSPLFACQTLPILFRNTHSNSEISNRRVII